MKTMTYVSSDPSYAKLEQQITVAVSRVTGPLFRTAEPEKLFDIYLSGIPESERQHYNCHCCRRFVTNFMSLVKIDANGYQNSPLLPLDNEFFQFSTTSIAERLVNAKVTGVFAYDGEKWGTPKTGEWSHLHGVPLGLWKDTTLLKTQNQVEAEKLEDFKMVIAAIKDYSMEAAIQAVRVLEAGGALDQNEKTLGVARWFLGLHQQLDTTKNSKHKRNMTWLAVATAPPGFAHIRSTMISTLLDDIIAGMDFSAIKRRWDAKMHPLQYKRPTTPPSEGNIKAAEDMVAKLGVASAFERRFAKLEDVVSYWKPKPIVPLTTPLDREQAVFGHLREKMKQGVQAVLLPAVEMSWRRFREEVLPTALKIEAKAPSHGGPYFGLVTAQHADAKPILQWDFEEKRNPVSWFFHHHGSPAVSWGLVGGEWVEVTAICEKPPMWTDRELFKKEGEAAFLILKGAVYQNDQPGGLFFPDCMKAEFHAIRSVIEAHSKSSKVLGREEGTANGLAISDDEKRGRTELRVNGDRLYRIDRWN